MNPLFYIEKLKESEEFNNFIKENPDSYLSSCFFVIDKQADDNKQHVDFFCPKDNKFFSFQFEEGLKKTEMDNISNDFSSEKLDIENVMDFEEVEKLILDEMKNKNINNKIQKIILVLSKRNKNNFWTGTVFISGLGLIRVNIDDKTKNIVLFEKKSFFDFVKKVK